MNNSYNKNLLDYLFTFLTKERKQKIESRIKNRTRHLTVVVEDIYQPHNASAVLRSCECMGIQDVHIIENRNAYNLNPDVAIGSSKWINLYKYNKLENNTISTIKRLKKSGYTIIATSPHKNDVEIDTLDISNKTALLFGNEKEGLSKEAMEHSDGFVKIPMYGFTESFNISVSAALCLFYLSEKLRKIDVPWQLSKKEQEEIKLEWVKNTLKHPGMLIKEFQKNDHNKKG